jgi:hypothetical protein
LTTHKAFIYIPREYDQDVSRLPDTYLYKIRSQIPEPPPLRTGTGMQFLRSVTFDLYSCTGKHPKLILVWQSITESHPFDDKHSEPSIKLFLHIFKLSKGMHSRLRTIGFHRDGWIHTKYEFLDLNNNSTFELVSHYWSGGKLGRLLVICPLDGVFQTDALESDNYYKIEDVDNDGKFEIIDFRLYFPSGLHSFSEREEFPDFYHCVGGGFMDDSNHFQDVYSKLLEEYESKLSRTPQGDRYHPLYKTLIEECQDRLSRIADYRTEPEIEPATQNNQLTPTGPESLSYIAILSELEKKNAVFGNERNRKLVRRLPDVAPGGDRESIKVLLHLHDCTMSLTLQGCIVVSLSRIVPKGTKHRDMIFVESLQNRLRERLMRLLGCLSSSHTMIAGSSLQYFKKISGKDFGNDVQRWRKWIEDEIDFASLKFD